MTTARVLAAGAAVGGAGDRDAGAADRVADEVLVARHRAGDSGAFPAIYRNHVVAVHRRLTRILGPIPEREDLLQDVELTQTYPRTTLAAAWRARCPERR